MHIVSLWKQLAHLNSSFSLGQASKEFKKGIEEGAPDTMTVPQSATPIPELVGAGSPIEFRDTTEVRGTSDR